MATGCSTNAIIHLIAMARRAGVPLELEDLDRIGHEVPVLANITEFGATPMFTTRELGEAGASIVLYPLSAFRAASAAALQVYQTLRQEGTQQNVLDIMQTRMDLYDYLGYHEFEQKLDQLFASGDE